MTDYGWTVRRRERLDGLTDLLDLAAGKSVLDLGCNRGLASYEFVKRGATWVTGVDKNAQAIATARHLFDDVTTAQCYFMVHDLATGWPPVFRSFDVVLMLGVYHKLRRQMSLPALNRLIDYVAGNAKHFGWNGAAEEGPLIDAVLGDRFEADVRQANDQWWGWWRLR